jgi:hypothetical protein
MSDSEQKQTAKNPSESLIKWIERMIGFNLMGSLIFTAMVVWLIMSGRDALAQTAHDAGVAEAIKVSEQQKITAADLAAHKAESAAKYQQLQAQQAAMAQQMLEMKLVNIETSMNVKMLVESKGLRPINLSDSRTDGGQQ